jgi:TrmH family RNA methyltransferase
MKNEEITSLKDEHIQFAKGLNTLKGRLSGQKILIEGIEAINWAIQSNVEIDYILASKKSNITLNNSSIKTFIVSDGLLKKVTGTKYLIQEVAVGHIKNNTKDNEFIVVLDNVKDYGNLGTIVRTCHAFGIGTLISTNYEMDLYQKKTVDASRGKVFSTNLIKFDTPTDAIKYLRKNNYQIVTTSPHGCDIQSMITFSSKPIALVIGNETNGVSDELLKSADDIIQIPMQCHVESLNVGVAAGISIYELKLKQVIGMIEKKIKTTLGREINVTAMLIQNVLDKKLSKVSQFTSTQLIFMMVLKCDAIMDLGSIQRQFGLLNDDIDDFLTPLIEKKYIIRQPNHKISITETGIEIIGKFWSVIENAEVEILKEFTEEEVDVFKRLLIKMKDTCIKILNEE